MKVVHLSTYLGGGAGIAAYRLHEALVELGIESDFLYLHGSPHNHRRAHRYRAKSSSRVKRLRTRFSQGARAARRVRKRVCALDGTYEIFSSPYSGHRLSKHRLIREADIVHLHWVANFVDFPTFFSDLDKPVVWTVHDMNPFLGGFHTHFDRDRNGSELSRIDAELQQAKLRAYERLGPPLHCVHPSRWQGDIASASRLLQGFRHSVIHNGVDVGTFRARDSRFCRDVFDLPREARIMLFVSESIGNFRKGFHLLTEALERLDVPDLYLVAVGESTGAAGHPAVHYLPSVSDERLMAQLYSAADVFVLPTLADNLPNVMVESLCAGTPFVAFPIGGITEVVEQGESGYLTAELSGGSLARTLDEFFRAGVRQSAAEISRAAHERFSAAKQARAMTALYETHLGRG